MAQMKEAACHEIMLEAASELCLAETGSNAQGANRGVWTASLACRDPCLTAFVASTTEKVYEKKMEAYQRLKAIIKKMLTTQIEDREKNKKRSQLKKKCGKPDIEARASKVLVSRHTRRPFMIQHAG